MAIRARLRLQWGSMVGSLVEFALLIPMTFAVGFVAKSDNALIDISVEMVYSSTVALGGGLLRFGATVM